MNDSRVDICEYLVDAVFCIIYIPVSFVSRGQLHATARERRMRCGMHHGDQIFIIQIIMLPSDGSWFLYIL